MTKTRDNQKKIPLNAEKIAELQKELVYLGVVEEFTDYRISDAYLQEFLEKYSELSGRHSYIVGSVLMPLFTRLKEQYPHLSEEEMVTKAHELFPVVRGMLEIGGVFKLIKQVSKKSDAEIERELKEGEETGDGTTTKTQEKD